MIIRAKSQCGDPVLMFLESNGRSVWMGHIPHPNRKPLAAAASENRLKPDRLPGDSGPYSVNAGLHLDHWFEDPIGEHFHLDCQTLASDRVYLKMRQC